MPVTEFNDITHTSSKDPLRAPTGRNTANADTVRVSRLQMLRAREAKQQATRQRWPRLKAARARFNKLFERNNQPATAAEVDEGGGGEEEEQQQEQQQQQQQQHVAATEDQEEEGASHKPELSVLAGSSENLDQWRTHYEDGTVVHRVPGGKRRKTKGKKTKGKKTKRRKTKGRKTKRRKTKDKKTKGRKTKGRKTSR